MAVDLPNNSGALSELVNQLKLGNQNLSQALVNLNATLSSLFPRGTGTFTLTAAASTTVTNVNVAANSVVQLTATNAGAATLMGSAASLYHSATVAGTSFTVATADGSSAAGTETFEYSIWSAV